MSETAAREKRRHARTDVLKGARVSWQSGGQRVTSRLSDLGLGGLFIEAEEPPEIGTTIDLVFEGPGKEVRARATVRRIVPGKGMGVEFITIGSDDQARLRSLFKAAEQPKARPKPPEAAAPVAQKSKSAPEPATAEKEPIDEIEDNGSGKQRERRAHLRHKIAAHVELTEESGAKSKGHLANLGEEGAYIKTETTFPVGTNLKVLINKGSEIFRAQTRVVYCLTGKGMGLLFTSVGAEDTDMLQAWLGASLETTWLAANRRRSQRIALTVPVVVAGANNLGTRFEEDTATMTISPHGALVLLSATVNKGQRITLSNVRTKASVECAVVYVSQGKGTKREVGLSFALPNKSFWKVAFPPSDWSPHHADAKRNSSPGSPST